LLVLSVYYGVTWVIGATMNGFKRGYLGYWRIKDGGPKLLYLEIGGMAILLTLFAARFCWTRLRADPADVEWGCRVLLYQ
jgi:hypothetical protein